MQSRFMFVAAVAASLAAPLTAEPAKTAPPPADRSSGRPPTLLLASAEVRSPAPLNEGQATPPVKRPRAARVTTCRCAGQLAEQP